LPISTIHKLHDGSLAQWSFQRPLYQKIEGSKFRLLSGRVCNLTFRQNVVLHTTGRSAFCRFDIFPFEVSRFDNFPFYILSVWQLSIRKIWGSTTFHLEIRGSTTFQFRPLSIRKFVVRYCKRCCCNVVVCMSLYASMYVTVCKYVCHCMQVCMSLYVIMYVFLVCGLYSRNRKNIYRCMVCIVCMYHLRIIRSWARISVRVLREKCIFKLGPMVWSHISVIFPFSPIFHKNGNLIKQTTVPKFKIISTHTSYYF
jgi:hypothetical protein